MFREIIAALPGRRVLVVGDAMLDEYIYGEVKRISPEAPIPIVEVRGRDYRAGGAGNVAANIAALGGVPLLCGVVGADGMAAQLAGILQATMQPESVGLIQAPERPTTVKSRVMAAGQQMLRLDAESRTSINPETEDAVLAWVGTHIASASACILSDYAKGVLTDRICREVIDLGRAHGLPVIVDPKGQRYERYAGATVITPNMREAVTAANLLTDTACDLGRVAGYLLGVLGGASLLITRSEEGMSLYRDATEPVHIPTHARNVYDVTGAGDTVVGTLSLALSTGATLEEAAWLSNVAAGIVCGKLGAATVTCEELATTLESDPVRLPALV